MILGQRLSVYLFLFVGFVFCCGDYAQAAMPLPDRRGGVFAGNPYFAYGANLPKGMQDLMAADNINNILDSAERQLEDMRDLPPSPQKDDKIQTQEQMIQSLKLQRNRLLGIQSSSAKVGTLMARGLGGKTWDSFGFQQDADSFSDGIKKGLMVRMSEALGEAISSKLKATVELVLGGTWDFMLLSGLDLWEDMCKVLFHDSKDPFKTKEINGWKKLISEAMEQIEKNVKDGPKDSFRGHDMTRRSNFEIDEDLHVEATNNLNAWRMYIVGCAEQFDYFIFVLDSRKQYYKKDDIICFYAEQIQNRLSDYRALMLKAGSVKEFDEFIESNKSLLPAMRKNVEQLFTRLAEEVEPRTLGLGGGSDSMRRTDTAARVRPTSYDDNMPNHFSGGWPS